LFEVVPKPAEYQRYLDIAAGLRPALERQDGFLFIDRFRCLGREGTILSHSLWRDEAALAAWRGYAPHRGAQAAGREGIFTDYRIRVGTVVHAVPASGSAPIAPDHAPAAHHVVIAA